MKRENDTLSSFSTFLENEDSKFLVKNEIRIYYTSLIGHRREEKRREEKRRTG